MSATAPSLKIWLTVLSLALVMGCTNHVPIVSGSSPKLKDSAAEAAYQAVFDRFTARKEIYDLFDTRLFAGTTFQAEAFRRAKASRRAAFERMPEEAYQKVLAEELAEARTHHAFFFGVHVNDPKFDDFGRRESVWRLALVTPSGEVEPIEIRRIGRSIEPLRAFYPYLDTFWVGYELRFPLTTADGRPIIPDGTKTIMLRLSSTLGNADFEVNAS